MGTEGSLVLSVKTIRWPRLSRTCSYNPRALTERRLQTIKVWSPWLCRLAWSGIHQVICPKNHWGKGQGRTSQNIKARRT